MHLQYTLTVWMLLSVDYIVEHIIKIKCKQTLYGINFVILKDPTICRLLITNFDITINVFLDNLLLRLYKCIKNDVLCI